MIFSVTSVAMDGDTALIGAYGDDDNGSASGSAYVFTRSEGVWTDQAKLTASDAASHDYFGYSVAVDGDTALIGAHANDDSGLNSGAVYVFTRNAGVWTEQAKLTASDGALEDYFGTAVALDGDTALIGACLTMTKAISIVVRPTSLPAEQGCGLSRRNSPRVTLQLVKRLGSRLPWTVIQR